MLIAENIAYTIKGHHLLRAVNFSIRPGELVAIMGANGAGKSTLLNVLNGENLPSEGQVSLHSKLLTSYTEKKLATLRSTMAQHHQLSADFSVREVVLMGRYPHFDNRPAIADEEAVTQTMELCGVEHLAERSVLSLSGGERQRVHYARVLAQLWSTPDALLLLDEPTSAMDIRFQHQTLAIAKGLAASGWMVVAVIHDMNLAAQYADRLMMMKNGRKLLDGTPCEVLNPRNIFTVFGIDAEVQINPKTLKPVVFAQEFKSPLNSLNHLAEHQNIS